MYWLVKTVVWHTVVLLAFTIPKAYELRKDEVDHMYHKARHHSKVREFMPPNLPFLHIRVAPCMYH